MLVKGAMGGRISNPAWFNFPQGWTIFHLWKSGLFQEQIWKALKNGWYYSCIVDISWVKTFTNKTSVSSKHLSHIMLQQGSSAKKDHQRKHRSFIKMSFSGIPLELFTNKQKAICNCHNMNTNHSFIMGILVGTSFPLPVESWTANFVQYYIDLHCHLHPYFLAPLYIHRAYLIAGNSLVPG